MREFITNNAQYTPLIALALVIYFFIQIRNDKNSVKYRTLATLIIGTLVIGLIAYIIGAIIGADYYCQDSQYAECMLGGIFVGGPLSFTIFVVMYLYIWVKKW